MSNSSEDRTARAAGQGQAKAFNPVGQGEHVVEPGECLVSIAEATGHFWEKLWNHPQNSEVKRIRKDPNILYPGDRIHIPAVEPKEETGATDARHRFKRKGVPSVLHLQCLALDEPLANQPYRLSIDGRLFTGRTDRDGCVKRAIPPGARQGVLVVGSAGEEYTYELELGHMNPLDSVSGAKARLNNLGFNAGAEDEEETEGFKAALRHFQEEHQLDASGEYDQATKDKLREQGV